MSNPKWLDEEVRLMSVALARTGSTLHVAPILRRVATRAAEAGGGVDAAGLADALRIARRALEHIAEMPTYPAVPHLNGSRSLREIPGEACQAARDALAAIRALATQSTDNRPTEEPT